VAVAGILVVVAIIIAIDVPHMLRKRLVKELWIFSFLLLFGTVLCIARALHVWIPNPLMWLTFIYKPFSGMLKYLLM